MSASIEFPALEAVGLRQPACEARPHRGAPRLLGGWERPLATWAVIALCTGFWYALLHFIGLI